MNKDLLKTGTTTIGIVCSDGIVLAADKRATAGNFIAQSNIVKVQKVSDFAAMTFSGLVSDAQLGHKLIKAESELIKIRKQRQPYIKEIASIAASISYNKIRQPSTVQSIVGFMIGGYDEKNQFKLFNVGIDGSLADHDDYNSTGSGSVFAFGVLESKYKKGMSVDEGVELAFDAVNTAMQRDNASGNGVDIIKITKDGVEHVLTKKLNTRLEL